MPRDKALRTFLWEFPPKIVPGSEETKTVVAPILTDAYALAGFGLAKEPRLGGFGIPPRPARCGRDAAAHFRRSAGWMAS